MIKDRLNIRIKLSHKILFYISKIEEFKGHWHGSVALNPRILGQLKRSVIITSTGASTRIEGSQMSDSQVDRFLRGLNQSPPKNRDEEEVAGYADILGRIFDHPKTLKVTEGTVLQLHDLMLAFSQKDILHRGKYKSQDNRVAIVEKGQVKKILFEPTSPWLVKKEMDDAFFWLNTERQKQETHSLVIIANFIFEFLAIHPFQDGNGRLSRALTNLLMLQAGYSFVPYVSLEEIIEERQYEYYTALRATQKHHKTDQENIEPWLLFFLGCVLEQTRQAVTLLEGKDLVSLLSPLQKVVYEEFLVDKEYSVATIQQATGVAVSTIKQSLKKLLEHQLIERLGQGRATRYKKR